MENKQTYKLSVHYADGSGEVFKNVSLPYVGDQLYAGVTTLTFTDHTRPNMIIAINFSNIRKFWFEPIEVETVEAEVVE